MPISPCPSCNAEVSDGTLLCPHCGTRLSPEPPIQGRARSGDLTASPPALSVSSPLSPDTLLAGRYRIVHLLGAGAFGRVYLAHDEQAEDHPAVAIKELPDAPQSSEEERHAAAAWFRREVATLLSLDHPSIPTIQGHWTEHRHGGPFYLVMDYIPGETLESRVRRDGAIPWPQAVGWGIELCALLSYLHQQTPPFLFRDLKPANIMVHAETGRLLLIDFGIARRLAATGGTAVGTWGYVPFEGVLGRAESRSDIYGLGATLHTLISGQAADATFTRLQRAGLSTEECLRALFAPLHTLRPEVPLAVSQAIAQATAFAPEDRCATAQEFARVLQHAATIIDAATPTARENAGPNPPVAALALDTATRQPPYPPGQGAGMPEGDPDLSSPQTVRVSVSHPRKRTLKWLLPAALVLVLLAGLSTAVLGHQRGAPVSLRAQIASAGARSATPVRQAILPLLAAGAAPNHVGHPAPLLLVLRLGQGRAAAARAVLAHARVIVRPTMTPLPPPTATPPPATARPTPPPTEVAGVVVTDQASLTREEQALRDTVVRSNVLWTRAMETASAAGLNTVKTGSNLQDTLASVADLQMKGEHYRISLSAFEIVWAKVVGQGQGQALVRKIGERLLLYRRGQARPLAQESGSTALLYDLVQRDGHWLVGRSRVLDDHMAGRLTVSAPTLASGPASPDVTAVAVASGPTSGPAGTVQSATKQVMPSVVRVEVRGDTSSTIGTGFIVASNETGSYILTNDHVVQGAASYQVRIIRADGTALTVQNMAEDAGDDLAVIKVQEAQLPAVVWAPHASQALGEDVVALGYAEGLQGTPSVTSGVVSALARDIGDGLPYVQHSAFINHGNSGGPLADLQGRVLGVNSYGLKETQGMFFAIPGERARPVLRGLIATLGASSPSTGDTASASPPESSPTSVPADAGQGAAGSSSGSTEGVVVTDQTNLSADEAALRDAVLTSNTAWTSALENVSSVGLENAKTEDSLQQTLRAVRALAAAHQHWSIHLQRLEIVSVNLLTPTYGQAVTRKDEVRVLYNDGSTQPVQTFATPYYSVYGIKLVGGRWLVATIDTSDVGGPATSVDPSAQGSPTDTINAFYGAINQRDYQQAYSLFSADLKRRVPDEAGWAQQFANETAVATTNTSTLLRDASVAIVSLSLESTWTVADGSQATRHYGGVWMLHYEHGAWALDHVVIGRTDS